VTEKGYNKNRKSLKGRRIAMTCLEAIRAGLVVVRDALAAMEEDVLSREYGSEWWDEAVLRPLDEDGKRPYGWPDQGDAGDLDLQTALKLVGVYHWELFSDTFDWGGRERGLLQAMIAIRNQYEGHVTPNREKELTPAVTDEIMEGMARFVRLFDKASARKIEAIEVPRAEDIPEDVPGISFVQDAPAPRASAAPVKRVPTQADPEPEDRPLTPEERKKLEASGYRSLWDEEEDEPISFYSRKPAPPPEPQPRIKPVLYQGVRAEEEEPRRRQPGRGGSALNLKDLRRTQAPAYEEEDDRLSGMPRAEAREEETADPEPFPVRGKNARTASASAVRREPAPIKGRPWWEERREEAPQTLRREVMEQVRPAPPPKEKKESLLTVRQKWTLGLWIALGVLAGTALLLLDWYLKRLWLG